MSWSGWTAAAVARAQALGDERSSRAALLAAWPGAPVEWEAWKAAALSLVGATVDEREAVALLRAQWAALDVPLGAASGAGAGVGGGDLTVTPTGGIVDGRDVTLASVGLPGVGLTRGDLEVISGNHTITTSGTSMDNPYVFEGYHVTGKLLIDANYVLCRPFSALYGVDVFTNRTGVMLEDFDLGDLDAYYGSLNGGDGIHHGRFKARRGRIMGFADVAKMNYGQLVSSGAADETHPDAYIMEEIWGRTWKPGSSAHCDGIQSNSLSGEANRFYAWVRRNNLSPRPVNVSAWPDDAGNASMFLADSSTLDLFLDDNLLHGRNTFLRPANVYATGNYFAQTDPGNSLFPVENAGHPTTGERYNARFPVWSDNLNMVTGQTFEPPPAGW